MLAYQTWNALAWRIGGRIGDWMIRYDGALGEMSVGSRADELADGLSVLACSGSAAAIPFAARCAASIRNARCSSSTACASRCASIRRNGRHDLKQKPGSEVVEFDTGHWVMSNDPLRFNQVVADWLAR